MPLDKGIYFCIKYYLYIIYLLYGWGELVSSIQVQQGVKITPVPFEAGETLLSALRRAGYSIPAACGGKGRCGKCRVKVNGVPRLACKTKAQDAPEDMRRYLTEDGQGNGVFHLTKAVSRRYSGAARAARRDGG